MTMIDSFTSIKGADSREVMRAALTDSLKFYNELHGLMRRNPFISARTWRIWRRSHKAVIDAAVEFRKTEPKQ